MDEAHEYDYSIFEENFSLPLAKHDTDSKTKEQILLIATIHFAKNGYSAVTMRDIAKIVGIQQSSIYNHFESKEVLWKEVLDHATNLYMLYFDQLEQAVAKAQSFEEVLELILHEAKQMRNAFTCYAFSMIQAEQFRNEDAQRVFCDTFLNYSIDFIQGCFDRCVARCFVAAFDTRTVATIIMHTTLIEIEVSVHKRDNHAQVALEDPNVVLSNLQRFILQTVAPRKDDTPST